MKTFVGFVLVLVLSGSAVLGGVYQLRSDSVDCGGKKMSRGDICTTTEPGSSTSRDFNEERENSKDSAYFLIGLGVFFLVGGGAVVLSGTFERRKIRAAQKQTLLSPPQA
jgi:hypothetical protein